jgi:peptidoglycan hydrolase CwlO-like protein
MRVFSIIFFTLCLIGCSELGDPQQYINKIQELEASKKSLQHTVTSLNNEITDTNKRLSIVENEAEGLRSRNKALEKMSEERIKKFWSMYEPDVPGSLRGNHP